MADAIAEDDLLPISALQHLLFCERQCALIHIEQLWVDNALTVQGQQLHERADSAGTESRHDVKIVRGLPLRSKILGLIGRADVVEFHLDGRIAPVEYKRGRSKAGDCDRVQLCAQAICLEEEHATTIADGALYYGATRRREVVIFDADLRATTANAAHRLHQLIASGVTPHAMREPKCDSCSLLDVCLPDTMSKSRVASRYLDQALSQSLASRGGPS
ncbi:MAG: CRISPR-associated protein Cas4 [Gemmatimonadales bacterium]